MQRVTSVGFALMMAAACCVLFITCAKEYSFEGGNIVSRGTAMYSLKDRLNNCIGHTVNGSYYVGTPVGATDNVDIQVRVDSPGTYSFSTNSLNGIQFSTSGSFTDTGVHTITMVASGTPVATGNFTFSTSVDPSCTFTIEVKTKPVTATAFTLSGAPVNCQDAVVNGTFVSGRALTASNSMAVQVNVTEPGSYVLTTDTLDGIYFSASGTFINKGQQTVTLTGSGNPTNPGNLFFKVSGATKGCTVMVSVVNPQPLATYVLESGPGNPPTCVSEVSGIYTAGSPLNDLNTVRVKVYITEPGNFTIESEVVNGIQFSYTGTFAQLGGDYVILKGRGTPIATGTFTFIPQIVGPHPLGGASCGFAVPVK